ncbi:hypothetical protein [Novosphingobium sp. Chol11]|jgi:hypothetical protein|uniref:hypothetical protein n=1 Tax=Novosphingobium sp. Chol11 TaxID=1385763 RepID=UPI000BE44569|nr:hypothetical protein [Novosphingobium sp. Chol11]
MPSRQETSAFIRSAFRSVWSLELMCVLRKDPERPWSQPELVAAMRSSDLVVQQSVDLLLTAGLVVTDSAGSVRYQPANEATERMAAAAEALYIQRPDAVRRMIVAPASSARLFADAFRLRREE